MILNYIHWHPNPVIIDMKFIKLRWYGLLWIVAIFISNYIIRYNISNYFFYKKKLIDKLEIYSVFSAIIGARLGHCLLYNYDYYIHNKVEFLFIWNGGLSSHGSAIGLLIGLYYFAIKYKIKYIEILDLISLIVPFFCSIIRIANLINSEIIGIPTKLQYGFIFDNIDSIPRHPVQLYESILYLILFFVLIQNYKINKLRIGDGYIFSILITLIFSFRFVIEFLKESEYLYYFSSIKLNIGQILSIPFIIFGVLILICKNCKKNN